MREATPSSRPTKIPGQSDLRAEAELFGVSLLILFLELACIRWFPAHVLFLTFFTNIVLLACFLGMSVGCLAANRKTNFIYWTPPVLAVAMIAAHLIEHLRAEVAKLVSVGNQASPQLVFFGTEYITPDPAGFFIPVESLGGFFFVTLVVALIGPGQELGRALQRIPDRVRAYSLNISGSVVGIALFALCSRYELTPFWWFGPVAVGVAYLALLRSAGRTPWTRLILRVAVFLALVAVIHLPTMTVGTPGALRIDSVEHLWSPYYRIDFERIRRSITVNLITHQDMVSRTDHARPSQAYPLPYLLNRDSGRPPFEDVLIIGSGSGNDVSRALQWGARRVDAVEIDPVILRLGKTYHLDGPYHDPRVSAVVDDGRNFLRSTKRKYDLVIYALVDSLVLHSSYSNIRLESYLFTRQAFEDVRRVLKPGGQFVLYNYFRQGWIVARIFSGLKSTFGTDPLVLTLPPRPVIEPQSAGGFTVFMVGGTDRVRDAFLRHPEYWLRDHEAPSVSTPNGFAQRPAAEEQAAWKRFMLSRVHANTDNRMATDDWPFLYLRRPMVPTLTLRGMAIMGSLAFLLIFLLLPRRNPRATAPRFAWRMFFLGAGFMLIETKAVVHMALLFGSTWMVNSVVFFAVLVMILFSNLFVLRFTPGNLGPYYVGLLASLALNIVVPLDFFLGMGRVAQVASSCLLVFAPIFFAGVVFAVCFRESSEPDRDFGANTAGAMAGGLAENASMLLGFRYLLVVAVAFYLLSAVFRRSMSDTAARP
jgi:SAM-dependent methyltransferase